MRFIDLFCGIGGFHVAATQSAPNGATCVYASDIDPHAQLAYRLNYGINVDGDITTRDAKDIPEHDLLLAGFPCQAFSIIGKQKGFQDKTRGTLFFDICRILKHHAPPLFLLENVKQLSSHDKGRTIETIDKALAELGYFTDRTVLNALNFGLPQKRERTFIVGFKQAEAFEAFHWPDPESEAPTLTAILEKNTGAKYQASEHIRNRRLKSVKKKKDIPTPAIWHENKNGNVSPLPYSCALRAFASHNYLLVDGKRRLTERELLRLQGFPETFQINGSYSRIKKQTGNAIPIPVATAILKEMFRAKESS